VAGADGSLVPPSDKHRTVGHRACVAAAYGLGQLGALRPGTNHKHSPFPLSTAPSLSRLGTTSSVCARSVLKPLLVNPLAAKSVNINGFKGLAGHIAGRSERIRTSGPCVPNTVLYQAELHSGQAGAYSPARQCRQGGARSARRRSRARDAGARGAAAPRAHRLPPRRAAAPPGRQSRLRSLPRSSPGRVR
jgi:hypothetical protein